jgi:hypothetical protein
MEYKCGSCREVSALSPKARFCPVCGSSSLILVVKELTEPTQKETVGVYKTATIAEETLLEPTGFIGPFPMLPESEPDTKTKEEEDRPRRKR